MKPPCAPVLLIVFNRPDLTLRVFEQIRNARPPKLYVAADGPRSLEEEALCAEVRSIASQVDWPCALYTLFRNKNLGCKLAVSGAITWFFEHEEMGIVLEDDCLPNTHFFDFCSTLLPMYANHPTVGHISGYTALQVQFNNDGNKVDYNTPYMHHLSHFAHIWGWAGYRRVWQHYSLSPLQSPEFSVKNIPGTWKNKVFWIKSLLKVENGYTNTWDFQYLYCLWKNQQFSILPYENHVVNIGFDPRATNTSHANQPRASCIDSSYCQKPCTQIRFGTFFNVDYFIVDKFFKRNLLVLWGRFITNALLYFGRGLFFNIKTLFSPKSKVFPTP